MKQQDPSFPDLTGTLTVMLFGTTLAFSLTLKVASVTFHKLDLDSEII